MFLGADGLARFKCEKLVWAGTDGASWERKDLSVSLADDDSSNDKTASGLSGCGGSLLEVMTSRLGASYSPLSFLGKLVFPECSSDSDFGTSLELIFNGASSEIKVLSSAVSAFSIF